MSKWLVGFCAVLLGVALAVPEAEARRFGGARSLGVQRNVPKQPPTAAPAKPAQQQQAGQNQAGQQQAANAAPSTASRWGGILGGLALGGLLGYLFAGNGLGGILLLALLAIGAVLLFRMLAQRGMAQPQRMQYAGLGQGAVVTPPNGQAGGGAVRARPVELPQGFDEAAFLRGAKMNFIRLQAAHDEGRLDEIREFTTDEMYEALRADPSSAGQRTDVMSLQADLVELATENDKHWASVRFTGLVRETPNAEPEGFSEVWHLVKPTDGSTGWLLAGIQQMH